MKRSTLWFLALALLIASWPAVVGRERGQGVATWWDGEHQHALVGELSEDELQRLVLLLRTAPTRL